MKQIILIFLLAGGIINTACRAQLFKRKEAPIRLITLDPGHFHAALVQKSMYKEIDPTAYVYAPRGADVKAHLDRIDAYNEKSTNWKEEVYLGNDFLNRMISDKKGNVVIMAGNNRNKTYYISRSVNAGFNVLSDKPMAIDQQNFIVLKNAFATAAQKNLTLYDIMTERYEITNSLQREFAMIPLIFGQQKKGTPAHPGVEMESIHYFYKYVSGSVLTRPDWSFDTRQQGEAMQDVGVHLVDLTQWECFPGKIIDYKKDIQFNSARHWTSAVTLSQFKTVTKLNAFPAYLKKSVTHDTVLRIYTNGELNYKLFGVNARLKARWAYKATAGGDSHSSVLHGTKADLVIKQGAEQHYSPVLYIVPVAGGAAYEKALNDKIRVVQAKYPGVDVEKVGKSYEVIIPDIYKDGHEAHFAVVMNNYLNYLQHGNMPKWEVPDIVAKYYTTTMALELARRTK